jgi:hypothetical protein
MERGGCDSCLVRLMEAKGWILRLGVNLINVIKLITGLSKRSRMVVVVGWPDREKMGDVIPYHVMASRRA